MKGVPVCPYGTEVTDIADNSTSTPSGTTIDLALASPADNSLAKRDTWFMVCTEPNTSPSVATDNCAANHYDMYCNDKGKLESSDGHLMNKYPCIPAYCSCSLLTAHAIAEAEISEVGTAIRSAELASTVPTHGYLAKRSKFGLTCSWDGTTSESKKITNFCKEKPYKYDCTAKGRMGWGIENIACVACRCVDTEPSIGPCLSLFTTDPNQVCTKITATGEIENTISGEVLGFVADNGTVVVNEQDVGYKMDNGTVFLYPTDNKTVTDNGQVIGYESSNGTFVPDAISIPTNRSPTSISGLPPGAISTISVGSNSAITRRSNDTVGPTEPSGFRLYCVQGLGYCALSPYLYRCDQTFGRLDARVDNYDCDIFCKCFSLTVGCYVVTIDNATWVCEGYSAANVVTVHEMAADGSMMPNGTVVGYID